MRGVRRSKDEIELVLGLREDGTSLAAIARTTELPYGTVKNWCRGDVPVARGPICDACGDLAHAPVPEPAYAYLLGIYLGDGCLSSTRGRTRLCISCDASYPGIVRECRRAIAEVAPHRRSSVHRDRRSRCVQVQSYGPLWSCLFPQHGPGRKHHRSIELCDWQAEIALERHPGRLLRGLIHSDGWRGTNRVRVGGREYAYPRYQFSNRSDDIRNIFTAACDRMRVEWRKWGRWNVSVARRDSVALLDTFVGPKA